MTRLILTVLVATAACEGGAVHDPTCEPGQVRLAAGACQELCLSDNDCPATHACLDGVCESGTLRAPRILMVDGSGAADPTTGHAAHHLGHALLILGENLSDVSVSLSQSATDTVFSDLMRAPNRPADDTTLTVALPTAITDGDWVLEVANAVGSDQASLSVLQGEPGPPGADGVCDASACNTQTLPGVARVTSIRAAASHHASVAASLELNGIEEITSAAAGLWLSVISRTSHQNVADDDFNRLYDVSDPLQLSGLIVALGSLTTDDLVIVITQGDISDVMHDRPVAMTSLADALTRLGANPTVGELQSGEAMVLAGHIELGPGQAQMVISPSGATLITLLADEHLFGSRTVRYDDVEALTAMGPNDPLNPLHHDRYTDADARSAMGTLGAGNPRYHDRYTDSEAVAALATTVADLQAQIDAASAQIVPAGAVVAWSGAVTAIPAGWALCDGTQGTPDLTNRFVVGAGGTYAVSDTGGAEASAHVHPLGSHAHTNDLQVASGGTHSHITPFFLGSGSVLYAAYSGWNSTETNYRPSSSWWHQYVGSSGTNTSGRFTFLRTKSSGSHSHSLTGGVQSVDLGDSGAASSAENRPPYFALAYIMKK